MEKEEVFNNRIDLGELNATMENIRKEIAKVLIGQTRLVDHLLVALLSDGHILLEGVPGIAKTLSAKLLARTIRSKFSRIQFTPDLMPSDIIGTNIFNMSTSSFEFNEGPIFSNIVLIDEINRAPAKTQSALFEVMEERQITVDGKTYPFEKPFLVLATQNPIEQEGTYRLPEAQLDRFLFKFTISYPSATEEEQILLLNHENKGNVDIETVSQVITPEQLHRFQMLARSVHIDDNLRKYIVNIVTKTRTSSSLYLGGSPRASINIMASAKSLAAIRGRDFVTPDDIKEMVFPVLNHRILLVPEREMEGLKPEDIIKQILESVEIPR